MQHAFSYTRFSSDKQKHGTSLERQQEMRTKWLTEHETVIYVPELSFQDLGISGYSGKHLDHGLGKIMAAIDGGHIGKDWLCLVESMDRLGRLEPMDMMNLLQSIITAGVTIVTLDDGQEYSRESIQTNTGLLFLLVAKFQQSHQFSETLSRRVASSWDSRRKAAKEGKPISKKTVFYRNNHDQSLKQPHANAVAHAFRMLKDGAVAADIRKYMIKTIPDFTISLPGIRTFLRSKNVIGYWDDDRVFPPVIDDQLFWEVQEIFNARTSGAKGRVRKYVVSGLVRCGECGYTYSAVAGGRQMKCSRRSNTRTKDCTNSYAINMGVAEYLMQEHQAQLIEKYAEQRRGTEDLGNQAKLRGEIESLTNILGNLTKLIEEVYTESVVTRIKEVTSEKVRLEAELRILENSEASPLSDTSLVDLYLQLEAEDIDARNQTLKNLGLEITVYKNKTITVLDHSYLYTGYKREKGGRNKGYYSLQCTAPREHARAISIGKPILEEKDLL